MRLLIDTHILLWWMADDPALPAAARTALQDRRSQIFVSAASIWEISIKSALGRLIFPLHGIEERLAKAGFMPLGIDIAHAARAGALPPHHQDPFDRMLVAQAQLEGLTLVSVDAIIRRYAVAVLGHDG
ncbi:MULTISPECIES: type II toxin-antitoxin system VapC family toxin [Nitrospirillum]|uniref:type II toxin-antitoxin system VapC family toxin n=1 Tax=Nitrospirillum amazonense TaxID=28077 RepID=UPI0011A67477|nr:type II toxin-antitoxin system VapC family toxin [Nitrospirillum amazonense]MEC4591213.1 type II toxin-antitoxin system VapC family toxin [Nitrospirillum amazonense]